MSMDGIGAGVSVSSHRGEAPGLLKRPHVVVVHGEWSGVPAGLPPVTPGVADRPGADGITMIAFAVDAGDGSATEPAESLPALEAACAVRRVRITPAELTAYREGFASQGVWPGRKFGVEYRPDDYRTYCHVNRRSANAVCASVRGPTWVFVEDHHLALVPQMVRQACARNVLLIARWPVPWPGDGAVESRPWGLAILEGLLGADLVLMASAQDRRHFLESARECCGASPDEFPGTVLHDGRRVAVLLDRADSKEPALEVAARQLPS